MTPVACRAELADSDAAIRRVAERYLRCGRFARHYVAAKLRRDPVYAELLVLARQDLFGKVVDMGCGRGQLGLLLLEAGVAHTVQGVDWNGPHLRQARQAAAGLRFQGMEQDLSATSTIPEADTVIFVDVLYQLDTTAQMALLHRAASAARSRILVRTPDPGLGWRSTMTRWSERLGRGVWPHSGARVNAQPLDAIAEPLVRAGFSVTLAPCWRGTPFANVLLSARRVPRDQLAAACRSSA